MRMPGDFAVAQEYLGNGPRLVVTPLTDRIYVTATQAMASDGPCGHWNGEKSYSCNIHHPIIGRSTILYQPYLVI